MADSMLDDRESALARALIMGGAAMMQPGPGGLLGAIGRGGMMGMQAYDQTFDDVQKRQMQAEAIRRVKLQTALEELSLQRQQALMDIATRAQSSAPSSYVPSVVDTPEWVSKRRAELQQGPSGPESDPLYKALRDDPRFQEEAAKRIKMLKDEGEEFATDVRVGSDGMPFLVGKRGGVKRLDRSLAPQEELVNVDLGGQVATRTKHSPAFTSLYQKSMTPGEQASNQLGWANHYKPQIVDLGSGQAPVAWAPNGRGGISTIPTGLPAKQEKLPSGDAERIMQLDELVAKARSAMSAVEKNPDAIGPSNKITPDVLLNLGPQRTLDTRAKLAELSTFILNARSGAAVTEHEYKRLEPFLATQNDNPKSARAKLASMISTMEDIVRAKRAFYSTQGYNVPGVQFGSSLPGGLDLGGVNKLDLIRALEKDLRGK